MLVWIVLLGSMAEPSLLCVNCAKPPPPHRRTWGRCVRCAELNLPSTYYCGDECAQAHWPKHKVYHKLQKQRAEDRREGTQQDRDRLSAEAEARRAERSGDVYDKRFADAMVLSAEDDYHATARAWRKIIKEWPEEPDPYFNLAVALDRSDRDLESAQMFLKAMELHEEGTEVWAYTAALAFDLLRLPECDETPKPEWWNDEGLKALSAQVAALAPDDAVACATRARVLSGGALIKPNWNAGPRAAAEVKEAATWYRRAAKTTRAGKQIYEQLASKCDEYADPLLAEEEAEAAKARAAAEAEAAEARAAAEAEAAEALKVAEAKAAAVAEELLAEEKQEKQAASTKAGKATQVKGKKSKGNGKR